MPSRYHTLDVAARRNCYYVNGENGAPIAATAQHSVWAIWNPSSTRTIVLVEFGLITDSSGPAGDQRYRLRRTTARGTAGSTITPTAEHHSRREAAPQSGFVLDLGIFSVQPTLVSEEMPPIGVQNTLMGPATPFLFLIPRGIEIPPGTGVAWVQEAAQQTWDHEVILVVEEV